VNAPQRRMRKEITQMVDDAGESIVAAENSVRSGRDRQSPFHPFRHST
jgi:hypothetical protein